MTSTVRFGAAALTMAMAVLPFLSTDDALVSAGEIELKAAIGGTCLWCSTDTTSCGNPNGGGAGSTCYSGNGSCTAKDGYSYLRQDYTTTAIANCQDSQVSGVQGTTGCDTRDANNKILAGANPGDCYVYTHCTGNSGGTCTGCETSSCGTLKSPTTCVTSGSNCP